jgi:hypothetical protein
MNEENLYLLPLSFPGGITFLKKIFERYNNVSKNSSLRVMNEKYMKAYYQVQLIGELDMKTLQTIRYLKKLFYPEKKTISPSLILLTKEEQKIVREKIVLKQVESFKNGEEIEIQLGVGTFKRAKIIEITEKRVTVNFLEGSKIRICVQLEQCRKLY